MGRKKTRRSQIKTKKRSDRMENRFNCPECNNESVVKCKIEKSSRLGYAYCTLCEASYKCSVNNLSHPVDVYSSWIDNFNR
ncbi:Elf1-like transcription elongation factor [Hamiltosporidium tvaerminnensis]|uniref:Transcription elongation factor 1 homolog n=3 Tax=Hamiltosporidium TaxID=1176354 RepID=A0A4V2JV17_9MICR|nr:Elf1-like transcription elongation factor [Hamiltosporidium magnivora]TBU02352.1 Elf1-like transcription elongation factor [Hamiltosporidium tvaerminnensis]TBU17007.1 Elf1-like transcription elongation factor [Hamiltosporidium tvaerminnensis]